MFLIFSNREKYAKFAFAIYYHYCTKIAASITTHGMVTGKPRSVGVNEVRLK